MRRSSTAFTVLVLGLGLLWAPSSGAEPGAKERRRAADQPVEGDAATATKDSESPETADPAPAGTTTASSPPNNGDTPKFNARLEDGEQVEGEWIVALQPFARPSEAAALARAQGGTAGATFERVFPGFVFKGSAEAARRLSEHPRVRKVTPNGFVQATAETVPSGVARIQADRLASGGNTGQGVLVAVLDTGIDLDHPDLTDNLDTSQGKNCVSSRRSPDDDNGHGTHVAGTIAAVDNERDVLGVAPGAKVVPVKVLDSSGSGTWGQIICGIDRVVRVGGIGVINMSLSGGADPGSCDDGFVREAICAATSAGIVVVAAAGNDGSAVGNRAPARFPEVLAVSALDDRDDGFASFSNYGPEVDLIAPGVNIRSTRKGGGTTTLSGTSMAAPHVAGAAALALADGVSPGNVRNRVLETGECPDGAPAGSDGHCDGSGPWSGDGESRAEPLVNALGAAGGDGGDEPGNAAPTVAITSPSAEASVSGSVTVQATASDGESSAGELTVDVALGNVGASMTHEGNGVFVGTVDTTGVLDGPTTLQVTARDPGDGTGTDSIPVTVANGSVSIPSPVLSVTNPDDGDRVDGRESIVAKISGASADEVEMVEYQVDETGSWRTMAYRSTKDDYKARWETTDVQNGDHTITVRATVAEQTITAEPINVTVDN